MALKMLTSMPEYSLVPSGFTVMSVKGSYWKAVAFRWRQERSGKGLSLGKMSDVTPNRENDLAPLTQ